MHWKTLLLTLLILGGCQDKDWQTKEIAGLMPALAFEMVDENCFKTDF